LEKREKDLTAYFKSINQSPDLQNNAGFLRMLQDAMKEPTEDENTPKTPVLKGLKLTPQPIVGRLLILA
jgi:hypothetical protein